MSRATQIYIVCFTLSTLFLVPEVCSKEKEQNILSRLELLEREIDNLKGENRRLREELSSVKAGHGRKPLWDYHLPRVMTLAGEEVPLHNLEVKERLEKDFYLILGDEPQLVLWIKRCGRAFPLIEERLRKAGLPDDLKYLAVVESGLRSEVISSAGASGFWQFITTTAKRFGLKVEPWMDERRDLRRATDAAIQYLSFLRKEFGSWSLAMAAYNCGEGRLRQALAKQGKLSYYDLVLPSETERYVIRIAAVKEILSSLEGYGVRVLPSERYREAENAIVKIERLKRDIPLTKLANIAGTNLRTMLVLNPPLVGDRIPQNSVFNVRIPRRSNESASDFLKALQGWNNNSETSRNVAPPRKNYHIVRAGDTLFSIANANGTTVQALSQINRISKNATIKVGQRLKLP